MPLHLLYGENFFTTLQEQKKKHKKRFQKTAVCPYFIGFLLIFRLFFISFFTFVHVVKIYFSYIDDKLRKGDIIE